MRIIACLSWYDENPEWLARTAASLADVVDYLIAIDGPYTLWEAECDWPKNTQHRAITDVAAYLRIPCALIKAPPLTEVDKRNHMIQLAHGQGDPNDWLLILDADEEITHHSPLLHHDLEHTAADVATVRLTDHWGSNTIAHRLYRNHPDLHIEGTHYTYMLNGRNLWTADDALNLTSQLHLYHRKRPEGSRREAKRIYSEDRDRLHLETPTMPTGATA